MNTGLRVLLSVRLFFTTIVATLLLVPNASQAQLYNTATGTGALPNTTFGNDNTADGYAALASNNGGSDNIAVGLYSLGSNKIGSFNIAVGNYALSSITGSESNVAVGHYALRSEERRVGKECRSRWS